MSEPAERGAPLLMRAAPADREWPIWMVGALYLLAAVAYVVIS